MIQITKSIEWDMGHRVPNHKSKCRNLHGHRYRMEVTICGELVDINGDSSEGMVYDFSDLKEVMTTRVHDVLDHGFMIHERDRLLMNFFNDNTAENLKVIRVPFVPTAENIAQWCYEQLKNQFSSSLRIVRVRIFETPNSWADCLAGQ